MGPQRPGPAAPQGFTRSVAGRPPPPDIIPDLLGPGGHRMVILYAVIDFLCAALCAGLAGVVFSASPRRLASAAYSVAMLATGAAMVGLGMMEVCRLGGGSDLFW